LTMGTAHYKVPPDCPTHGKMKLEFGPNQYICVGFDGEGCEHVVPAEEVPWRILGEIEYNSDWFKYE
jgi:hypothetical protein